MDGSDHSRAALRWAADLAAAVGGELVVVHAVGLLEHMAPADRGAEVETWCRPFRGRSRLRTVVRDGPPSLVIAAVAEELGCDLIVVGTRGVGLAPRSLGSTTLALLEDAHRPWSCFLRVEGPRPFRVVSFPPVLSDQLLWDRTGQRAHTGPRDRVVMKGPC